MTWREPLGSEQTGVLKKAVRRRQVVQSQGGGRGAGCAEAHPWTCTTILAESPELLVPEDHTGPQNDVQQLCESATTLRSGGLANCPGYVSLFLTS